MAPRMLPIPPSTGRTQFGRVSAAYSAGRPGWRNWQTRRTQNPVPARAWEFDSPPPGTRTAPSSPLRVQRAPGPAVVHAQDRLAAVRGADAARRRRRRGRPRCRPHRPAARPSQSSGLRSSSTHEGTRSRAPAWGPWSHAGGSWKEQRPLRLGQGRDRSVARSEGNDHRAGLGDQITGLRAELLTRGRWRSQLGRRARGHHPSSSCVSWRR